MKRYFILFAAILMTGHAAAREFDGVAAVDLKNGQLTIPCVKIENAPDDMADAIGQHFDVILNQKGNSMNFELSFAEGTSNDTCSAIAEISSSKRSDQPEVNVQCKIKDGRIKISVEGEDLPSGYYTATITNENDASSGPSDEKEAFGDELEFHFDSDSSESGATLINNDFVSIGDKVSAVLQQTTEGDLELTDETTCSAASNKPDKDDDTEDDSEEDNSVDDDSDDD